MSIRMDNPLDAIGCRLATDFIATSPVVAHRTDRTDRTDSTAIRSTNDMIMTEPPTTSPHAADFGVYDSCNMHPSTDIKAVKAIQTSADTQANSVDCVDSVDDDSESDNAESDNDESDNQPEHQHFVDKPSSVSTLMLADKVVHSDDNQAQSAYSQQEYEQWQRFIEEQVGFILPTSQQNWLWQAINKLSRKANLSSEVLLEQAKRDKGLIQEVIEAVLIPQSRFFRHQPTLDFILRHAQQLHLSRMLNKAQIDGATPASNLSKAQSSLLSNHQSAYLPKHAKQTKDLDANTVSTRRPDLTGIIEVSPTAVPKLSSPPKSNNQDNDNTNLSDFKVWSVGCSFGQEVWSIAMTLEDAGLRYKIWGLDVNKSALKHAAKGRYELKQLAEIPQKYRKFVQLKGRCWCIAPVLQQHSEFLHYNLITSQLPDLPLVDVIVCQNVLIYFRHFEQRDILARLVKRLKVNGYMVLAPGEASQWQHPKMRRQRNSQVNVWQKVL